MGYALGGCVSAMHRAEGIGYIQLRKACKRFGEFGIVLLLFGMETKVFEQEDFAFLKLSCFLLCLPAASARTKSTLS